MVTNAFLPVRDGDKTAALRTWLAGLLTSHKLDALLVLLEGNNAGPAMALVSDPDLLRYAVPLAPVMPGNAAQVVSRITRLGPAQKRLGVVLRPCEIRALVELVKLKQADVENITVIGMDCPGTLSLSDYRDSTKTPEMRKACRVCDYPAPVNADITIGLMGPEDSQVILLQADNNRGENLLQDGALNEASVAYLAEREKILTDLRHKHSENRRVLFERFSEEVRGPDRLLKTLADCTNCHNCRIMCPICYCKECFFDSPTFDLEADRYLGWAEKKGAIKMPSDTLLYHLTRLNHIAASCVGCGMCSEACPNGVPVFDIFRTVSSRVQSELDYIPGREISEELPLSVFKEDEFKEIGE